MTQAFHGACLDMLLPAVTLAGYIIKQHLFFSHVFNYTFKLQVHQLVIGGTLKMFFKTNSFSGKNATPISHLL